MLSKLFPYAVFFAVLVSNDGYLIFKPSVRLLKVLFQENPMAK